MMSDGFLPVAVGAFEMAFAPVRRVLLHGPLVAGAIDAAGTDGPLLLVANHSSWWDGLVLREVQRRLRPRSPLFTLMTMRELRRHPWLRGMGCVGLEPGNVASVLRAFRRLRAEARRDPNAVFAVFPQGAIWPVSRRPLGFQRGVAGLASLLSPVSVVPVAIRLEPLNRAAPTAFASVGDTIRWTDRDDDVASLERAVQTELDTLGDFLDDAGEDAVRHWPDRTRR